MDCKKGVWLGSSSELKDIKSDQVAIRDFGNFIVPFGIPKMIFVDADEMFAGIFKNNL